MSWAIWITGLPGSGKSVLARGTAEALRARGERVTVLELDVLRKVITPEPTYSDHEREIVYRALVYVAAELTAAGVPVLVDATGHRRAWRELARASVEHFAEVQLTCPIDVCRAREDTRRTGNSPAGISARARRPGAIVPGVDVAYEPAAAPELTLDTAREATGTSVSRIVALAERLGTGSGAQAGAATVPPQSWVLWITGLPGSGKTTIAAAAAEALRARGIAARVVDLAAVQRLTGPAGSESSWESDVGHRTLAYTAKLLADAGSPVLVDATAPRRIWRQLARRLIPRFAVVQLVCPPEVCISRECAARWALGWMPWPDRGPMSSSGGPDVVLDYEPSLDADLTIHTDVQTPWTAVEEVLVLARRLGRPDRRAETGADAEASRLSRP